MTATEADLRKQLQERIRVLENGLKLAIEIMECLPEGPARRLSQCCRVSLEQGKT